MQTRNTILTLTMVLGSALLAACGDAGTVTSQPLASKECIGDDSAGSQCTLRSELWECRHSGTSATCRRAPLPTPDPKRSFTCKQQGAGVSCETSTPGSRDDESWSCKVKGQQTTCKTKGTLVPPKGTWRCHLDDLVLECEGEELEPGDDKGGQGELEPGDDKGGQSPGQAEAGDDKGGQSPGQAEAGDDKGGQSAGGQGGDDKGGQGESEPGDDKGAK